ncbi:MAG TPA: GNAT family N-acetyltransferase, partial [Chthoniobacterales bacterium]|nr:GNAT family N-acetyltransferase [Chthoniobacterales bacterium]
YFGALSRCARENSDSLKHEFTRRRSRMSGRACHVVASDRAFWGRGVATEALSAFLILEQTRPLHAGVAKHNVASIRVLQKCGFKLSHSVEDPSNEADASHVLLTLTA